MAKFNLRSLFSAVKKYQITFPYVVPPILISLAKESQEASDKSFFDLHSVKRIFCGASPLSEELTSHVRKRYPGVLLGHGYCMTEFVAVISQHPQEFYNGSSGCLVPGLEARIVDPEAKMWRDRASGERCSSRVPASRLANSRTTKQRERRSRMDGFGPVTGSNSGCIQRRVMLICSSSIG